MWVRVLCLIVISYISTFSHGANILALIPTPAYSHQIAYQHLWKELSLRGHQVTVVTTDPIGDPTLTNLTEIDVSWSYNFFHDARQPPEEQPSMWSILEGFLFVGVLISDAQLSFAPVQDLKHKKFDVVLVEYFFPEFLGFAEIFGCPKILVGSLQLTESLHSKFGNPSHPVLNPDFLTPFYGTLSFQERVTSTLFYLHLHYFYLVKNFPTRQSVIEKHFNISRDLDEIVRDVDMVFVNTNPILQGARAFSPTTIEFGGFRNTLKSLNFTQDVKDFLDNAVEGFIYFSLGSNVKSKDLRKETLAAIIQTLKEMPYKVLWKFEADELPGKPDNVKLIKWAPQQSVLSHPNIKLFVTQGGLQSMEESIYSEVPAVIMPFFGDQEQNAKLMKSKGIAVVVEVQPYLNKEELKSAMLEVIKNPIYKNAVRRLKQLALDSPMTGLEKAVWWTEYVIRNKGAKHLRNPAVDLPLYQYYLLDVVGFLLLVSILVISLVAISVKALYRYMSSVITPKKTSKNKKNS